jgi:hypothetical protein
VYCTVTQGALDSFQRVLDLENGEKGEWGFKALKQMIKINFRLSNFEEMMLRYKQLLTYIKTAVTRQAVFSFGSSQWYAVLTLHNINVTLFMKDRLLY